MTTILAVSDETDGSLGPGTLAAAGPDLVVACGDLPFDYLEYLVTVANVPLVYVPGNHDPDVAGGGRRSRPVALAGPPGLLLSNVRYAEHDRPGPEGCVNVDGRVVEEAGVRVAGLGGSPRYREGPNQYTQDEMGRRARHPQRRARRHPQGRALDLLVTHAPPEGVGDDRDPAHRGFAAFHRLVERLAPRVLVHGHVHPYGRHPPERRLGETRVINAVPFRLIEI